MQTDHRRGARRQSEAAWRGVRLSCVETSADPDAPIRKVILPASWPTHSAAGLAALVDAPAHRTISLIDAAEDWLGAAQRGAAEAGLDAGIVDTLRQALRDRCGAPSPGVWRGAPEQIPGFVLNLPHFFSAEGEFDLARFGTVAEAALTALAVLAPLASELALGFADLSLLLARLDLDYGSQIARDTAASLSALLLAHADCASARLLAAGIAPGVSIECPALPRHSAIPGLIEAARAAQQNASALGRRRHRVVTGIMPAGPTEALLGVETVGFAAPLAPITGDGKLAVWARARLAASGQSAESALAGVLAGADPFGVADRPSRTAMREAVAPFFARLPEAEGVTRDPVVAASRAKLPARRSGYTQKASVGGHKVFLRTGDYPDGRLGEIFVALPKESAAFRGLMDCFAISVSIALQHGVALDELTEAFVATRFGAAGAVDGDPAVSQASSVVDYVFRHLAANYLGKRDDPPSVQAEAGDHAPAPLLPLDMPSAEEQRPRRRRPVLKLVS